MSTKREQILAALTSAIAGVTSPTDLSARTFRSLKVGIDKSEAPIVVVEPISDSANLETIYRVVWKLMVRVSFIVRGDIPDQVADPLIEAAHAAIMADQSLGGLAMGIEPSGVNFELVDSDGGGGIIPVDYVVEYQTARESMTTL